MNRNLFKLLPLVILTTGLHQWASAQHNVPDFEQTAGSQDCGPTAAASCLVFWQQQGFPIESDDNMSDKESLRRQIQSNTGQGKDGVDTGTLYTAVQKVINGVKDTDGRTLKAHAATVAENPTTGFGYLDQEFERGEDIILLLRYMSGTSEEPDNYHFVTVRNWTAGEMPTERDLEFMDPLTGASNSATVTVGDYRGKTRLIFDYNISGTEHPTRVWQVLTVSPQNHTESESDAESEEKTSGIVTIEYRPAYLVYRPMRALHIRTNDPNPSHYAVQGLPAGWAWVISVDSFGGSHLSIFDNGSAVAFPSGSPLTVSYSGAGRVVRLPRSVRQCGDGTGDPDDNVLVEEDGLRILLGTQQYPTRPGRPSVAVLSSPVGQLDLRLVWASATGATIERYEVFDENAGERIGVTVQPEITLTGLDPDSLYALRVHAVAADDVFGPASHIALIHRNEEAAPTYGSMSPSVLGFSSPLSSWHEAFTAWTLGLPPTPTAGSVFMTTINATPDPLPLGIPGDIHPTHYDLAATSSIGGTIDVGVPYDEFHVIGSEAALRLYYHSTSGWIDLTSGVDAVTNRVLATLPAPGTVAIVNGQASSPAGDVPDTSLRVTLDNSGETVLDWNPSCLSSDDDYEIYEGSIGRFTTRRSIACSTNGLTSYTYPSDPGDRYFLVVPRNSAREGSYGRSGNGIERPQSDEACRDQLVMACP